MGCWAGARTVGGASFTDPAMAALLSFIGFQIVGAIKCFTDNKGAHDLCHRFTSAQNSRHVDRKLFKMREL